ncbi:MAG TPA: class I SAM-dependent methyltransferase [Acidimicrobiales bacterium]|nr:class I SAM-dependent methyltransferase [Acidimicrobiales bacterium]
MTYSESDLITSIDQLASELSTGRPAVEDLRGIDQFHGGGIEAVDRLIDSLALDPSDLVLDVGSGLGGPARRVAERTGCRVVGVDVAAPYVEAAVELTRRCGLADRVTFVHGDLATVEFRGQFDAAITMHVQMSVEDKVAWFSEFAERLRSGGRLAVWEVCRASDDPLQWPMPWSMDGSDSYLATGAELRDAITAAGFDVVEWVDETPWVRAWFAGTISGSQTVPVLPQLLDDGFTRVSHFAGAIEDGRVGIWRGSFVKHREPT